MTCAFNPEIACKRPSRNRKARSINKSFIYFFWRNKASAEVSSFPIAIPISNNVSKLSAKSEGVFFLWHAPISVEVVVVPQIITIHLSSTPPPPPASLARSPQSHWGAWNGNSGSPLIALAGNSSSARLQVFLLCRVTTHPEKTARRQSTQLLMTNLFRGRKANLTSVHHSKIALHFFFFFSNLVSLKARCNTVSWLTWAMQLLPQLTPHVP